MTRTLAIIPARSGSKGLPNKNIKELKHHPLIGWSIEACKKSKLITDIIVSTDSKIYAEIANSYGASTPFLRPKALSTDQSTDFDFIHHAIEYFDKTNKDYQNIVHIRPTTPLRDPILIDQAISKFQQSENSSALRSVHEMSETAFKAFEINEYSFLKQIGSSKNNNIDFANKPRQQFPNTYQANGYVDVLSVNFIKNNNLIHGDKVLPFVTPQVTEIDNINDFNRLEFELASNPDLYNKVFN